MSGRRIPVLGGLAVAVAAAMWGVAAYLLVPRLISDAYRGRSLELFNRVIRGQAKFGVDYYLTDWRQLADAITASLAASVVAAFVAWTFRRRLGASRDFVFQRAPLTSFGAAVLLSIWLGIVIGLVETAARFAKFLVVGIFSKWSNPDTLWMAPLATAGLFLIVGSTVWLVGSARRRAGAGPVLLILVGLGSFGVLRQLELGIHPVAAAVLALGIGVQVTRYCLSRWGGLIRTVRRSILPALASLGCLALILNPGERLVERVGRGAIGGSGATMPNVLLIILDTVRSQNLELYGYPRPTTPRLSGLAQRGVVFDHAVSVAPWTLPSHGALFTGRYHHELSTDFESPLDNAHATLAEVLRDRGYATGAFVANLLYATRASGLDRGFERYDDYAVTVPILLASSWLSRNVSDYIRKHLPGRQGALLVRKYAPQVNEEILQWLDGLDRRPFFAFVNYFDAHVPYERYNEYIARFSDAPARDSVFIAPGEHRRYESRAQRTIENYDSSIALIDDYVGRLVDELERRGLLSNTLVVITSDHGEQFWEHGLIDHANSLYMPLLAVPLLIVLPERVPAGVRVEAWVSLRDVPATILDLVGGGGLPGASLARLWRHDGHEAENLPAVLSELHPNPFDPDLSSPGHVASLIRDGFHYLVRSGGVEELYDLDSDPWEERNLAREPAALARLLRFREELTGVRRADSLKEVSSSGSSR